MLISPAENLAWSGPGKLWYDIMAWWFVSRPGPAQAWHCILLRDLQKFIEVIILRD